MVLCFLQCKHPMHISPFFILFFSDSHETSLTSEFRRPETYQRTNKQFLGVSHSLITVLSLCSQAGPWWTIQFSSCLIVALLLLFTDFFLVSTERTTASNNTMTPLLIASVVSCPSFSTVACCVHIYTAEGTLPLMCLVSLVIHYRGLVFFVCVHLYRVSIQPKTSADRLLNILLAIFLFSMYDARQVVGCLSVVAWWSRQYR